MNRTRIIFVGILALFLVSSSFTLSVVGSDKRFGNATALGEHYGDEIMADEADDEIPDDDDLGLVRSRRTDDSSFK